MVATRDTGQARACCLRIGEGCESGLRIAHARGMRLFAPRLSRAPLLKSLRLGRAGPRTSPRVVMCPSLRGIAPGRPMASPARAACAKRRSSASVRT